MNNYHKKNRIIIILLSLIALSGLGENNPTPYFMLVLLFILLPFSIVFATDYLMYKKTDYKTYEAYWLKEHDTN